MSHLLDTNIVSAAAANCRLAGRRAGKPNLDWLAAALRQSGVTQLVARQSRVVPRDSFALFGYNGAGAYER